MANVVQLLGFNVDSHSSAEEWALANVDSHKFVRDTIQIKGLGNLVEYPLWPVRWDALDDYLLRHQLAHNEANAKLGLSGTDLTGVDFKDVQSAAQWNLAHFREHEAWHAALEI